MAKLAGNLSSTTFVQDWGHRAAPVTVPGPDDRTRWGKAERMSESACRTRGVMICGVVAAGLLLSGCTSTAEPQSSASPTTVTSPSAAGSPAESPTSIPPSSPSLNPDYALTINIAISKGKTIPSGEKINVRVGQTVILNVTSDTDEEIHAHIGGPGYELPVKAGTPAKGSFTIDSPGSFEVESHHLEKIIVILNAR